MGEEGGKEGKGEREAKPFVSCPPLLSLCVSFSFSVPNACRETKNVINDGNSGGSSRSAFDITHTTRCLRRDLCVSACEWQSRD